MSNKSTDKKALLVIDMQKGSFTAKTPRFDTEGVVNRINKLTGICRSSGHTVVFIQHDGTKEGAFIPNTEEWELLDELKIEEEDLFVSKIANDCFYKSRLADELKAQNVKDLMISGCATDFCVEATVQSAIAKDWNITVVSDAHTTGNRPHLSAEQVIEHYNWSWQNMIPTRGSLKVIESEKVLNIL